MGAEMREYDYYRQVFSDRELPLAFVDRDALDGNIEQVRSRAESLPVRIASKSLRCRSVMEYVLGHDGFRGVMCYHGAEAAHLAAHGFDDDLIADVQALFREFDEGAVDDVLPGLHLWAATVDETGVRDW